MTTPTLTADEKRELHRLIRVAGRDRLRVTQSAHEDGFRFGLESRRFKGPVLVDAESDDGLRLPELADYLANRNANRTA